MSGGVAFTESAQVRVHPTGSVAVFTGAHAHGQGHETTFAQIASDALGVPMERIQLRHGDNSSNSEGRFTRLLHPGVHTSILISLSAQTTMRA